jgi:hypothetical protein
MAGATSNNSYYNAKTGLQLENVSYRKSLVIFCRLLFFGFGHIPALVYACYTTKEPVKHRLFCRIMMAGLVGFEHTHDGVVTAGVK